MYGLIWIGKFSSMTYLKIHKLDFERGVFLESQIETYPGKTVYSLAAKCDIED
mgnify:CR=1 FL=1